MNKVVEYSCTVRKLTVMDWATEKETLERKQQKTPQNFLQTRVKRFAFWRSYSTYFTSSYLNYKYCVVAA
jgi:hypothetical protein